MEFFVKAVAGNQYHIKTIIIKSDIIRTNCFSKLVDVAFHQNNYRVCNYMFGAIGIPIDRRLIDSSVRDGKLSRLIVKLSFFKRFFENVLFVRRPTYDHRFKNRNQYKQFYGVK